MLSKRSQVPVFLRSAEEGRAVQRGWGGRSEGGVGGGRESAGERGGKSARAQQNECMRPAGSETASHFLRF